MDAMIVLSQHLWTYDVERNNILPFYEKKVVFGGLSALCIHQYAGEFFSYFAPFLVIMMAANVLAPNRHQAIWNHHDDLTVTVVSHKSYSTVCSSTYGHQTIFKGMAEYS